MSPASSSTLTTPGRLRTTTPRDGTFPNLTKAYREVAQVARESGLMRRARWFYGLTGGGVALAFLGCLTGFILLGDSWFQLLIAAAFGIVLTQAAFLGHEAAHMQILAGSKRNERLALGLINGAVGMSASWWQSKHSRHHANPNRIGRDPDIEVDTISFIEEDAQEARGLRRLITKHQGWLFFPLLTLEGLNLHWQGVRHLVTAGDVRHRWLELGLIALRFAAFLVPVFLVLPIGMAFAFVGVQMAVFGVYMGAAFAPNHKGMPILARDAKLDFFTKQVRTSRNISGGWWATILFGGLNYQVEHHLFPSMARPYLASARRIVREQCSRLEVPYTEVNLWQSYAQVVSYLNRVGLAARDPFECHLVTRFR